MDWFPNSFTGGSRYCCPSPLSSVFFWNTMITACCSTPITGWGSYLLEWFCSGWAGASSELSLKPYLCQFGSFAWHGWFSSFCIWWCLSPRSAAICFWISRERHGHSWARRCHKSSKRARMPKRLPIIFIDWVLICSFTAVRFISWQPFITIIIGKIKRCAACYPIGSNMFMPLSD